jgi:hypothetical protein
MGDHSKFLPRDQGLSNEKSDVSFVGGPGPLRRVRGFFGPGFGRAWDAVVEYRRQAKRRLSSGALCANPALP